MSNNTRYKLAKKIARGGMAEIFLASKMGKDGFSRICCIKRILPHFAAEKEFIDMFRDEARLCQSLSHKNLVRVDDFQEVDGSWAIAMEFIAGSDLRALLAACEKSRKSMSIPMICWIGAEAARGLHYAHSRLDERTSKSLGIVHRDISPQNILISFDGEVKVTDFGIAEAESKINETKPGIVKGKYAYMSPEQISAKPVDARTDVFALGVVMWEMISMRRLFHNENDAATIDMVKNCKMPAELRHNGGDEAHPDLKAIILKALKKDLKERWKTAEEFENALRKFISTHHQKYEPIELSKFVKSILSSKFEEIRQLIQETLSATAPVKSEVIAEKEIKIGEIEHGFSQPKEQSKPAMQNSVTVNFDNNLSAPSQSVKSKLSLSGSSNSPLTPHSLSTFGSSGRSSNFEEKSLEKKGKRRSSTGLTGLRVGKKSGFMFNLALALKIFFGLAGSVAAAWGYMSYMAARPTTGRVTIDFTPDRLLATQDRLPIGGGAYILGPISAELGMGEHEFSFSREGYETKKIKFRITPGSERRVSIVLKKTSKSAPVVLISRSSQPIFYQFEKGLAQGVINPGDKMEVLDLVENRSYVVKITPKGEKNGFSCTFVPASNSWTNPFTVSIFTEISSCRIKSPN